MFLFNHEVETFERQCVDAIAIYWLSTVTQSRCNFISNYAVLSSQRRSMFGYLFFQLNSCEMSASAIKEKK